MDKNSSKKTGGFLGGLVILVIGIAILWNNEGRTVKMQSAINEAMKGYKDVTSAKINSKNEGKIIATKGKMDIGDKTVVDSKFNISVNSAKLERYVEMYQWIENCSRDEDDKETCTYTKEWSDSLVDSSSFNESGHSNPTEFKNETEEFLLDDVKVGAFTMPERLLKNLSYDKTVGNEQINSQYNNSIEGFTINDKYITNSLNLNEPQIGDERISFKYLKPTTVSMLGVQSDDTLEAFVGKKGKTIFEIRKGSFTGREILESKTKANNNMKWILRVIGVLLIFGGVGSLFSPLTNLTAKIPILSNLVNLSTGLITFILGTVISAVVIAIAWFRFRPLLSIILIIIAICLIVFLKLKEKNKSA